MVLLENNYYDSETPTVQVREPQHACCDNNNYRSMYEAHHNDEDIENDPVMKRTMRTLLLPSSSPPRRRVCFAPTVEEFVVDTYTTTWYTPADYTYFHQQRTVFSNNLKAHAQASGNEKKNKQMVEHAFEISMSNDKNDHYDQEQIFLNQEIAQDFAQHDDASDDEDDEYQCILGLEKYTLVTIKEERVLRKTMLREAVFELQDGCHAALSYEMQAFLLKEECTRLTRPSVLFAYYIGRAQAAECCSFK